MAWCCILFETMPFFMNDNEVLTTKGTQHITHGYVILL